MKVYHYDAFSEHPNMGNPAGVVLDADGLTTEEMLEVAQKVGFNETAFALASDVADIQLRYFTPGHEMNLCGHGTMAAIGALIDCELLSKDTEIRVETKAGILTVNIAEDVAGRVMITMQQAAPIFEAFSGSPAALAEAIGLTEQDIDLAMPIVYGSTGIWTVIVPVKTLTAFQKMKPNNASFPEILTEKPRASIHPFCLETVDPAADMHGRHFSSPFSGTIEDPVTGTASGVMGAYFATYIKQGEADLMVEQGLEIGRDGRVIVHIRKRASEMKVAITGTAIFVKELEV
ncbi:PhzF family phenazine biosynthesis isomerase [Listeria booriae]|uniref:PhzF family phenazine biosynthesis isomerase n=1 Tax=Listeria booriae TaxID=1552123 RepID=UPI001626B54A|nr:PhzF family phenazine biosynthesis isomerase [Listeria booriae]MBC2021165.1 PhzF family phenazine biosynthesis isomerase [Listeria booriae]